MVKVEFELNPKSFFQGLLAAFKKNRILQISVVIITLLLLAMPVHSMYLDYITPANAHERENNYIIDGDYGYISWVSENGIELGDDETLTIIMDESEFPEEAKERNIISVELSITVRDFTDDNEETSGPGCLVDPGENAYDSISVVMDHPSADSQSFETESQDWAYLELLEYPEFETYPFITGYTVDEIEELFDSSEEVIGEYSFSITANAESGDSTFECDRQDSSVTVEYEIYLFYFDVQVIEWVGPMDP